MLLYFLCHSFNSRWEIRKRGEIRLYTPFLIPQNLLFSTHRYEWFTTTFPIYRV